MIVGVNKIDEATVNYSQARYDEIKTELSGFLKKVGYNPDNVPFIPFSGWTGDNLIEKTDKTPWYKG